MSSTARAPSWGSGSTQHLASTSRLVVMETLEARLKKRWLDFLIEHDEIEFAPKSDFVSSSKKYFSASVRLVRVSESEDHANRISLALRAIGERERSGKALPPYAKFCALLTSFNEDPDKPREAAVQLQQPRRRSQQWMVKRMDDIFHSRESSLRDDIATAGEDDFNEIFPVFVYQHLLKTFGLRSLVEQTAWDLVYTIHRMRSSLAYVDLFARFLEESLGLDDLLFFFRVRETVIRHRPHGLDSKFERNSEIVAFASLVHLGAPESLKSSFLTRAQESLILPCDCFEVVRVAIVNYHEVSAGNIASSSSPSRTNLALTYSASKSPSSGHPSPAENQQRRRMPRLPEDVEDQRTLAEIIRVQECIKEQLEAVLNSPSSISTSVSPTKTPISPPRHVAFTSRSARKLSTSPTDFASSSIIMRGRLSQPAQMGKGKQDPGTAAATSSDRELPTRRKTLPSIQTTRSPEDSSASSTSPRSHPSFMSPSHMSSGQVKVSPSHQFIHNQQQQHAKVQSPSDQPATVKTQQRQHMFSFSETETRSSMAAGKRQMSEVDIESHLVKQTSEITLNGGGSLNSEKKPGLMRQFTTPSEEVKSYLDSQNDAGIDHSTPNTTDVSEVDRVEEDDDRYKTTIQSPDAITLDSSPEHLAAEETNAREYGPAVALQRATAKLGAAYLDAFVASAHSTSATSSRNVTSPSSSARPSTSPGSVNARFQLRRLAAEMLTTKTGMILDQVVSARHVHSGADCTPTSCPFGELRASFQKIVRLAQLNKPFSVETTSLARTIIDSRMVKREMDKLGEISETDSAKPKDDPTRSEYASDRQ